MSPLVETEVLHEPDRAAPALSSVPASASWGNPLEHPDWDARIMNFGDCCVFHGAAWLRVLHETYGFRPMYLELRTDHRPGSMIPVMEVNTPLTGKRGVSLPFSDFCPPLVSDPLPMSLENLPGPVLQQPLKRRERRAPLPGRGLQPASCHAGSWPQCAPIQASELPTNRLLQELMDYGKRRGWRYYECRGGRFDGIQPSMSFYQHRLNLRPSEESLFSGLEGGFRQAIRKAEREGVRVQLGNTLAAVRTFYDLHCQTRRKHGLPPQPFAFFRSIHRNILARDLGFVAIATCQQRPIAGAVFCHLGRHAVYKYGASLEAFQQFRGNNLVIWEAIKWYARNGFESLHFGRTSLPHDGLRRFKLGWGTTESTVDYFKYDLRKNTFVTEHDKANGWHNRVFSRLPVAVSRLLGALLYRESA